MPRCLTKLNSNAKQAQLDNALFDTDFSTELAKYYRGGTSAPSIDSLVSEINKEILPNFISGKYGIEDLLETLQDPTNALAMNTAFGKLLQTRSQINLKANLPDQPYAKNRKFDLVDELVKALGGDIKDNLDSVKEKVEADSTKDDAIPLDTITPEKIDSYIHERNYANLRAYRQDTFKGSSSIENITVAKFVRDVFLKNVFIDVDKRVLVDQTQTPGEVSTIDQNLKTYRSTLLRSMIDKIGPVDIVDDQPVKVEYSNSLLDYQNFQKTMRLLADSVHSVKYAGQQVSLNDPGKLFEITEEYKRTQHPDLQKIVDNFSDFVILSDFNKLFEYYGEGAIDVNRYNDDFHPVLRKYSTKNALSLDALNAHWDEQVQNGVELTSPLYKTIINNTPLLNYTTGVETGKMLYPSLVAHTFAPYFDEIDPYNTTESIKTVLQSKLTSVGIGRTEKNVLYTLYKKFYERDGDDPVVETKADKITPKRNSNTSIASFYQTVQDNQDQSLMELINKPLIETSRVLYAEAVELPDRTVGLSIAEARAKTAVGFTASRNMESHINMDRDLLFGTDDATDAGFLAKYNVQFLHPAGEQSVVKFSARGMDYELRASDNVGHDIDTIKNISKDLLGLDFNNDARHRELWEEIQSLAPADGEIAPVFLSYLKDAFDIVEARTKLLDPDFQKTLQTEAARARTVGDQITTGYEIIDKAIRSDRYFNTNNPTTYKFKLNNQNAKAINNLVYTAENNYTGNQLKNVTPTVEGTTVAGFSNYNYSQGLKRNIMAHRRVLTSALKQSYEKSPLDNNLFVNDPSFLNSFFIRGGAKVGSVVKGNTSQTDYETLHYNVNLGYFGRLKQALDVGNSPKPIFDVTVYSDKGQNPLPSVNNEVIINGKGPTRLFVATNGQAVDEKSSMQLMYDTSGQYYRATGQNIIDTWKSIYTASGHGSVFDKEVGSKKSISEKLTALNKLHDAGQWTKEGYEHGLTGLDAARFYANRAGVTLTNWVHYINNGKSFGPNTRLATKDILIDNIAMYDKKPDEISGAFKAKYDKQLVKFANELRSVNFKFDSNAQQVIEKLYPNVDDKYAPMGEHQLTASSKDAKVTDDVHPALRKFYWDYNLIQDNFMNFSVGSTYAHKGDNENSAWLTQSKRNVAFTASVRNYSLGLERGVEDYTRTAFVDDLTSMSNSILGGAHTIVDFDGASLETMSQRIKTWHSLNAKFNGDGGTVHKSFISHYDPLSGQFAETKHAAFAMTNEVIRQSQGSDLDLFELHKQLYGTDISTTDITKSWKDGVNLSSFDDVYYYDRKMDFKTGLMGTLHKLDSIKSVGKRVDGKVLYEVTTRNMSTSASIANKSTPRTIDTFFDLWQVLGGIDSVEHTDIPTQHFYKTQTGNKLYLTGNHKSHEKLVDFEAYMGTKGERIIPDAYVDGSRPAVRRGYKAYKDIFGSDGLVNSHIDLINKYIGGTANMGQLDVDLRSHDVKLGRAEFLTTLESHRDDLQDLAAWHKDKADQVLTRPYQRFKGANIDRISFAGAQKVGQFNMNNIETIHLRKRADWFRARAKDASNITYGPYEPSENENIHKAGLVQQGKEPKAKIGNAFLDMVNGIDTSKSFSFAAVGEPEKSPYAKSERVSIFNKEGQNVGNASINYHPDGKNITVHPEIFSQFQKKGYATDFYKKLAYDKQMNITQDTQGLLPDGERLWNSLYKKGMATVQEGKGPILKPDNSYNDPGIPGVTRLMTHKISNFNAGIQLNAWHETENATVTTPTQMLNALIFNAKRLGKVKQMYSAIGNIVDKELTYVMDRAEYNIPSLVRALNTGDPDNIKTPAQWYAENKSKLLGVFKDIMENKVAKSDEDEFTLEGLIVDMFDAKDFPIDDPQIYHSAVAELTNYLTKSGIRTKFDGMFAVLHPASDMMQLHDVKGGYIARKDSNGGFEIHALDPNESRVMQPVEYAEYKRLNEHLSNDPNQMVRDHAATHSGMSKSRNLKGQQVILQHSDGTTTELSAGDDSGSHLIPEAKALHGVRRVIDSFKDQLGDDAYKKLDEGGKVKELNKKYKAFVAKIEELRTSIGDDGKVKHPEISHVLDGFTNDLTGVLKSPKLLKGNVLTFAYETFSQSKALRDAKINRLEKAGNKKELRFAKEHEYFDKLNTVGQLFVGRLQKFLDDADHGYIDESGNVSRIPQSLRNPELFENAHKTADAQVSISRAECIAPITARKSFMLQEGDTIGSITKDVLKRRMMDKLDYFDVNADAVLISKSGKRIYLHKGAPAPGTKANDEHENITEYRGKKYFTNDSGDRLFQVPTGMLLTNINGTLHAFLNDKYELADNTLITNLDLGFGHLGDKFTNIILGSKENRTLLKQVEVERLDKKADEVFSSWQVYLDKLIGTRVPGQHYQSFQGMKIVGFSEGNNIHVATSVIDLSGADFDIDKQNIIYHSIDGDGILTSWHPAFDFSTKDQLEESLKLPMPEGKGADYFTAEMSPTGEAVDKTIPMTSNLNLQDVHTLNGIYHLLEQGYKIDAARYPDVITKLIEYEQFNVPLNGVKNFAVSSTNQIIESPSNFLYLSNGVSTDSVKQFSNRTPKAGLAAEARKENPFSQAAQKGTNMVGRMGIGIMASQMKVLSAIQYATNNTIEQISHLYDKQLRLQSIRENYIHHLDTIHDVEKHYTGPHSQQELEEGVRQINGRIQDIKDDIKYMADAISPNHVGSDNNDVNYGDNGLTLPNLNYNLLSDSFEGPSPFTILHRTQTSSTIFDPNKKLTQAKLAQMFDPDVADIDSQKLSSSTDNAKELDLGKINALPDVMTIYPSAAMKSMPDEFLVDTMTSPMIEMLIKNATKNVYDKTTADNSISNLLQSVAMVANEQVPDEIKETALARLSDNYGLRYTGDGFIDTVSPNREQYSMFDLVQFQEQLYKPAQTATLLAKYLGINQGIPSNNWGLYGFATTLQDTVNSMFKAAKQPRNFEFKRFLDSVDKGDYYHKLMINRTSQLFHRANIDYNPLYVLINNPHFAKQLSAFNASNTILRESSYRTNAIYHVVDKLRDMGYLRPTENIKRGDFQEVEKFLESTIINNFIASERRNNSNDTKERPVFYKGNVPMYLDDPDDRKEFVNWVQTEFLSNITKSDSLKGNAFIQDLRLDSKDDPLLFDKVDFMKLQMDTTNVKSNIEQGPFRDAYVSSLKQVYDNSLTDLQHDDLKKQNNIFNTLFWYNLIVNKNNITKNSYAKLLGDVMWSDNQDPNVYSRLFLLKGKLGKATSADLNLKSEPDGYDFWHAKIAGIDFNMKNLFLMHEFGKTEQLAAEQADQDYGNNYDEGYMGEDPAAYNGNDDAGYDNPGQEDTSGSETMEAPNFDTEAEPEEAPNYLTVERIKQRGVPGTTVNINLNGQVQPYHIEDSTSTMPLYEDNNTEIDSTVGYNPFKQEALQMRPDQNAAYDYLKLSIGNIHDLLSRLDDAVGVTITINGKTEQFDKNKDYDC